MTQPKSDSSSSSNSRFVAHSEKPRSKNRGRRLGPSKLDLARKLAVAEGVAEVSAAAGIMPNRGGRREKTPQQVIDAIMKLWEYGATYSQIASVLNVTDPIIAKHTKGLEQGSLVKKEDGIVSDPNSSGPKSANTIPTSGVNASQLRESPFVVGTKPPPEPETKPVIKPVLGAGHPFNDGGNNGVEERQAGDSYRGNLAKRWGQMFEVTVDPNVILLIVSDSMNEGFDDDLDGYFKKYVFPTLRQMRILKSSMPPVPEQDWLTAAQLMFRDAISWRKLQQRAQDEANSRTIEALGGDPETIRKIDELKKMGF